MTFDWKTYLNLACFLENLSGANFSQEATSRSTVCRAYYAAFCHAGNYAHKRKGYTPKFDVRDHKSLRKYFTEQGRGHIASYLEDLRLWQNACDYDAVVGNLPHIIKEAFQNSQDIIDELK